jgi:hypothetical protein
MNFAASTTPLTSFVSANFDAFWLSYGDMVIWGAGGVLFLGLLFGILETFKQTWHKNQPIYEHHGHTRR